MTRAPENLLAVRRLLLAHLNLDEDTVRSQDLEPAEVGIVGDPAHRGGYHCGSDRVVSGDYSVVESSRDRTGLTEFASALDVGDFSISVRGKRHTLATFSMWLVAQCKAGADDTRDIREVIYSPDGQVVRRWDRLGRRSSGDSSHRWHTHISFHRDAIKAGRDQTALFRRYLIHIGVLSAPQTAPQEDDMPLTEADANTVWGAKAYEYVDERGDGGRDVRTVKDILFATHAAAVAAANPERLAQRLAELLPDGTAVSRTDLEAALRTVLGSLDAPPQE
ncbi:hypothetical protein [Micromonospora sp. NPDC023633]|uniref:hypothetical protein n=1 Tax=Micromonospora sp. NPDC023633 TaxID=3154320 RepID=UPI0033BFDC49